MRRDIAIWRRRVTAGAVFAVFAVLTSPMSPAAGKSAFEPRDVVNLRFATSTRVSPDGRWIAYTVSVPRAADEDAGGRYTELYVIPTAGGKGRPFITGKTNVGTVRWSPDGRSITFLMRRGEEAKTQVWTIPIDGGEAIQVTRSASNISSYRWRPDGMQLAYVSTEPKSKRDKKLEKKGYGFIFYEENLKPRNVYVVDVEGGRIEGEPRRVTDSLTTWSMEYSPDGRYLALGASKKNLIDYRYAFQRVYLLDVATADVRRLTDNRGKLGNFAFSPDGTNLAYTAALTRSDHAVSQVFVKPISGGEARNLTEPEFVGHVTWVAWRDNATVVYLANEKVNNTLSLVKIKGGRRTVWLNSADLDVVFSVPSHTPGFKELAFTASGPTVPRDVYFWKGRGRVERRTTLNPWLADRELGRREVITYNARDGWPVQGLLSYPVGYREGQRYPLIVAVHGGPEAHHANSWKTSYSRPVQVLNGLGYVVFMPNYRSSTGYGLPHVAKHIGDAAGVEFDDVADSIDYLIGAGIADPDRVGLGGGSYGGFAAAWFSSYYTEKVKAVVMFVGISDLVSKRGTTDIPYEELFVHSGKKLEQMWEMSLKRSPIYYAHRSRTATLILGGAADPRVHPSQSIEFYRRLKMNGHPAVRLVQYPGEGHGNRKMPGRRDVLLRSIQWYNWFVRDARPLDGGMPPWDISDQYGVELPAD